MGKVIDDNLTDKQAVFVTEYLRNGFNATKAARDAGYAENSAHVEGCNLLRNPKVAEAIKARLDTEGITAEKVKIALAEIAFGGDLAELEDYLSRGASLSNLRAAGINTQLVKSAKVKRRITTDKKGNKEYAIEDRTIEIYSRLDALEKLGKVLAMFTDRQDLSTDGRPLELNIVNYADIKSDKPAEDPDAE